MRLIDADEMIKRLQEWNTNDAMDKAFYNFTMHRILEQPTIEPERKTGKWQKLYGYATPGGDPVWCCSECGKGIHVFGIEHNSYGKDIADHQWLSCPNCDTRMIGEEE